MTTNPEMNARICELLRSIAKAGAAYTELGLEDIQNIHYAAARIEELEVRCREFEKQVAAHGSESWVEVQKTCSRQHQRIVELQKAIADLMPFVLEDYMPDMATPEFKAAVEAAKKLTT